MEAKIDMVLLILAQLTGASMSLPVETQVTLSNRSIIWLELGDSPAIDQSVMVELYLNPRLPKALKIPVVIKELQPMDSGVKIIAELEDCSEEFDEWLTHTLFRYHRRALQASRQA
jgi:hypothetical protein